MKTIVTKSEFAERKGRHPSAISHWIAEGKITADALIGSGVRAKIWVERAEADLALSLDPSQQVSQERPIGAPGTPPEAPLADDYVVRERRARAIRAEEEAEAAQLRNAREAGRWIEAHKAQQAWGRELARVLSDLEIFLSGPLARTLAEECGLDHKTLAVRIRGLYREHRSELAERAASEFVAMTGNAA